jgi:hypothetical protein
MTKRYCLIPFSGKIPPLSRQLSSFIGGNQLKKILLVALVGFGAWNYYQKQHAQEVLEPELPAKQAFAIAAKPNFQCDGRQHCSQMTSRAEAEFFVRNCPNTKMDGDNDGIPCENDSRF